MEPEHTSPGGAAGSPAGARAAEERPHRAFPHGLCVEGQKGGGGEGEEEGGGEDGAAFGCARESCCGA